MARKNKTKAELVQELALLRKLEEKWRSVVSNAPNFIAIVDREGVMQFLNRTQPGHVWDAAAEHRLEDFIDPAHYDHARSCLEAVFRTGQTTSYQTLAAGPHDSQAWYETHLGPVMEDGQIVAVTLISTDITASKEAEALWHAAHTTLEQQVQARTAELLAVDRQLSQEADARRQSEERYRLIVESINDLIWEVNREGLYTYVSPAAKELMGYEAKELLGRSPFEFMPLEEARRHRTLFHALLAAGEGLQNLELTMLHKNGRRLVHETNFTPSFDPEGRCTGFRGVVRDVSDRRRIEQSLQQSHRELQAIYDGMVDGVLIVDLDTQRFVRANQAICRMLGYSQQEMISLFLRDIHPAGELPNVLNRFAALLEGRQVIAENTPVLRKDGTVFYADISKNLLEYQERPCIIGFFRDNTERKRAAEALSHEHQVLRQLLKSHDRDRQIIAYEIHDGVAQLLAGAIMQFEAYQNMRCSTPAAAAQGGMLVSELLRQCHAEIRRLISGLRPPVLDQFGLVAALQNLTDESMARWGTHIEFQHSVYFDRLEPSLENALYRIAQESLTNACHHSQSPNVRMELSERGDTVQISVRDWGIGFELQEAGEKCFGLAGIRERARLLGGRAVIDTRPGQGSHIMAELPTVARDPQITEAGPNSAW
ncbi:MAG: sensor histidine kinase [Pirellulaceae bacterium]